MSQKSILEQALLQMESLEEAMKQNSKGILASTMKGTFKDLLESKEEEDKTKKVKSLKNKEMKEEESDEDEQDSMTEQPEMDDEDDEDETNEPSDSEEDETEVPDDSEEDDTDMGTPEMGASDMEEPEMDEPEMGASDMSEPDMDDTLDMTNSSDEEVLRVFKAMKPDDGIVVKKDGNNLNIDLDGEEYIIKLDEVDDVSEPSSEMPMDEDEKEMEEEETIYEIELDEEETSEEEKEVSEEEEEVKSEKKENVKKVETKEAARTKWNVHGDKGGSDRAGLKNKKLFKAGSGQINEEVTKLRKQNDEYKKALVLFKEKLNEVAVFNANLAYATRLFTEHSTTKKEKLDILKRFDSVSTMNESKKLYSLIKTELDTKKPVTESVVDKITSTNKTSSSKNVLAESKAYENPQFKRMKDLMSKLK